MDPTDALLVQAFGPDLGRLIGGAVSLAMTAADADRRAREATARAEAAEARVTELEQQAAHETHEESHA